MYPLSRPTHSIVEEYEGFQKFKTFAVIRVHAWVIFYLNEYSMHLYLLRTNVVYIRNTFLNFEIVLKSYYWLRL